MGMKIAVPVNNIMTFYHFNPFTAPKFAIYSIDGDRNKVTFRLQSVVENPWVGTDFGEFETKQVTCNCDSSACANMQHISEHYALLDVIGGCDYLLVDLHCDNVSRALKNGGIQVYKTPPIIHKIDTAIKNFILGVSLASTFKHIHYAS